MEFVDGIQYTKDCRDFDHLGITCCPSCHDFPENELNVVQVDGEPCLLCCQLVNFFYPEGSPGTEGLSPEEKLLRAIFGEGPHVQEND